MGLREVQAFVTYYLRDPEFRESYRHSDKGAVELELGLVDGDVELVREIDLDDLDRIAVGFRDDRVMKRESEFEEFLNHLSVYVPPASFMEAFDRAYPRGPETQSLELDRFLAFAMEYLLGNDLPEYLLHLAYFCYTFCKLSIAPSEIAENQLQGGALRPYHLIQLRRPYHVAKFRYDVVGIAQTQPSQGLATAPPEETELLIQKDHKLFKRAQIYYTRDLPLLPELLKGRVMLFDLMSHLPSHQYSDFVDGIEDMSKRGIVDVVNPRHFTD